MFSGLANWIFSMAICEISGAQEGHRSWQGANVWQLGKDEDASSWGWSSWFNMIQLFFLKSTWLLQMAGWWQGTFRRETIWLDRSIWEGHIQMASTRKLRKISSWWADSNDFAVCRNLWYKVPACCVVFHLSGCWCWSIQLDRTSEINIDKAASSQECLEFAEFLSFSIVGAFACYTHWCIPCRIVHDSKFHRHIFPNPQPRELVIRFP